MAAGSEKSAGLPLAGGLVRRAAPLVPYIAISIGLFGFHSGWLALLGYHAGMLLVLSLDRQRPVGWRMLSRPPVALAGGACLFGVLGGSLLYFLWPFLGISLDLGASLARYGLTGTRWIVFIVYMSLVNPWLEELYWRGYLGNTARSLTWNDLLFSGYHLVVLGQYVNTLWLLVIFAVLTCTAWLWRQFTRLGAGLLVPIISHFAADVAFMLVIYHFST